MQEVIVKYSGDIMALEAALGIDIELLNENYAIITLAPEKIPQLIRYPQIEGIELPKNIAYQADISMRQSCIPAVQSADGYNLSGKGVIVAILDSGIYYAHPDFRSEGGATRILAMWDQTAVSGTPPVGFKSGAEYSEAQINAALQSEEPLALVPETDTAGHGTAVAGVAAGNGRASSGANTGAAPEASLLVVKLGSRGAPSFARTTELMRALKYVSDKAQQFNMPIAVNISFGTNNGAHNGQSLFEIYINDMAQRWKTSIAVAAGNEGSAGHHYHGVIEKGAPPHDVVFFVADGIASFDLTLWKNFVDTFQVELILPDGRSTGAISDSAGGKNSAFDQVAIYVNYSRPSYYSDSQEIFFRIQAREGGDASGMWTLRITATEVVSGLFDAWLPVTEEVTADTAFAFPSEETTLTLPSTAEDVITVGGYDTEFNTLAIFSGRGNTRNNRIIKPNLVAPAVGVLSASKNGGYDTFTGTSIAAPFVTGSAALMMQWGIVNGRDPFLYGERIKAFLEKGAMRENFRQYPDIGWGYGKLCLEAAMKLLDDYWKGI